MNIEVFIGKSGQLTSCDILKELHRLIQKNHLEDEVSLCASLCTSDFSNPGVPMKIGEIFTDFVTKDNLDNVFGKYVLPSVSR